MDTNVMMADECECENLDVKGHELEALCIERKLLNEARSFVRALSAGIADHEDELIGRIESGAAVEGNAKVIIRRRQNISWLTAFKERLGTDAVVEVKDEWPLTFYKELQLGE